MGFGKTHTVNVGPVLIGSEHDVVVQSMTNTDTADHIATARQVVELAQAGSEIVRITVNNDAAAIAVPQIRNEVFKIYGQDVPLVGCFHYNGERLLKDHRGCAENLAKFRMNPGNVGFGRKKDAQFESFIKTAIKYDKPIRIGANWGSLDQDISAAFMAENAKLPEPKDSGHVIRKALVFSAVSSAKQAEELGLPANKIILSAKVSRVQDLVAVYQDLAAQCEYPLHLGLTEAGMGPKGLIASSAALAILLQQGIGNTIRFSITPIPGESRTNEVIACKELLQALGLKAFAPQVTACPGCGRTTSPVFQQMALNIQSFITTNMPSWKNQYKGVESMNVAVMGCIVNGPGESKHANIGISLPGTGEELSAPVFIDGAKFCVLRGDDITEKFKEILLSYVDQKYGT